MPYIEQDKRRQLDGAIDQVHQLLVGIELDEDNNNMESNVNYVISRLMLMVYGDKDTTNDSQINDAIGVLGCVKSEYYRKVAIPFYSQQSFDNGEIQRFYGPKEIIGEVIVVPPATPNEE